MVLNGKAKKTLALVLLLSRIIKLLLIVTQPILVSTQSTPAQSTAPLANNKKSGTKKPVNKDQSGDLLWDDILEALETDIKAVNLALLQSLQVELKSEVEVQSLLPKLALKTKAIAAIPLFAKTGQFFPIKDINRCLPPVNVLSHLVVVSGYIACNAPTSPPNYLIANEDENGQGLLQDYLLMLVLILMGLL